MSALLTTTMTYMKEVIQALEEAGIRNQVKVMIAEHPSVRGLLTKSVRTDIVIMRIQL